MTRDVDSSNEPLLNVARQQQQQQHGANGGAVVGSASTTGLLPSEVSIVSNNANDDFVLSIRMQRPDASTAGGSTTANTDSSYSSYLHTMKKIQLEKRAEKLRLVKARSLTSILSNSSERLRSTLSMEEGYGSITGPIKPDPSERGGPRYNITNNNNKRHGKGPDPSPSHDELDDDDEDNNDDDELDISTGGILKKKKSFNDEYDEYDDDEDRPTAATAIAALIDILFGKGIISLCLLAAPVAVWAVHHDWSATWIFWLSFIVMIPLASILGDFTEEVALHTNETIGGLVNASFGNAVEVVIGIQALLANEIRVVQASMLGSILSNLLLVLGCCFFFGGIYHKEQTFNATAASANMGLLALSSIALVLPTPFAEYYNLHDEHALIVSRVAALFLIFMYVQLLVFQLKTHTYLFDGGDDEESAAMSLGVACIGLLTVTLLVSLFSEYLVGSIEGFTAASGVSRTFVGIVIIPIVGNAVEHVTAVSVSIKNKMDLAMGIAVGSCTQISLFVAPLTVLVGWIVQKDMTLNFPHFEIALYVLSVFTVSVVCSNPRCNWLEGSLLITLLVQLSNESICSR